MSIAYLITGGLGDYGGGSYPTAEQIAAAVRTELTMELGLLEAMAALDGLVIGTPLVVTPTSRVAGTVSQTIAEVGTTVTVTRT